MLPVPAQPPEPTIASLREAPGASGEAGGGALGPYWTFYWAVAAAQLARWLPRKPARVLDLSGGAGRFARQAAWSGHTVVEVLDRPPGVPAPALPADDHPVDGPLPGGPAVDGRLRHGQNADGASLDGLTAETAAGAGADGRLLDGGAAGGGSP
ncbi:hypothetical protein AB0J52_17340, partial [Spirillospora sp. NPDC049652]